MNALEGKRATPRSKPPFPQVCGLWGRPTIVNNAETIANIPHIVKNGPDWFKALSTGPDAGTKTLRRQRQGEKTRGLGTSHGRHSQGASGRTCRRHAGGLSVPGVIPGGASTDFLVAEHLDVKMDFDSVMKAGSRMGTGTMIVLDDRTCPVGFVHNLETFFRRESCGWCTPCREGLPWIEKMLHAIENGKGETGDIDLLAQQCRLLGPGNTYCALAPGAVEPLQSAIKYFREDFERHIREKKCPWENGQT